MKQAFKKANEPYWFVYYETNDGKCGEVRVFANTEANAREKAHEIIKQTICDSFVITGTSVI